MAEKKGLKIVELVAENVKKLKAIRITPDGNMVVLSGKNGAGKSSVLDTIWLALGGDKAVKATKTDKPVREGAEGAFAQVNLGDIIVTRTWKADGSSTLKVSTPDGAKYGSPQKMLDALIGQLSFDPLAFTNMGEKEQLDTLLGLVELAIDPKENAKKRQEVFSQRTVVNRDRDSLKAQYEACAPIDPELPAEEVSSASVLNEMQEAQKSIEANNQKRRELQDLAQKAHAVAASVTEAENKITDIEERIKELEKSRDGWKEALKLRQDDHADIMTQGKKLKVEVDALQDPDLSEFNTKLQEVEETNKKIRSQRVTVQLKDQYEAKKNESDALTKQIEVLDKEKADALKAAKFPIDGLGFDENGVTFNGIPFKQCSTGERLKISVAMALALNPTLRVIRISDGSLLDEDNLKMIEEMAAERDAQIWIEKVDSSGKVGIYIEDGEIKSGEEAEA